jgi:hypothetical protein
MTPSSQEMESPGIPGRFKPLVAPGRVGNQIVRVAEQLEVETRLGQHIIRICAQAPEVRRNRRHSALVLALPANGPAPQAGARERPRWAYCTATS